jgi:hypothetical protein
MLATLLEKIRIKINNKIYSRSDKFVEKFQKPHRKEFFLLIYVAYFAILALINHQYFHNNLIGVLLILLNMFRPYDKDTIKLFQKKKLNLILDIIFEDGYCLLKFPSYIIINLYFYFTYKYVDITFKELSNEEIVRLRRKNKINKLLIGS